MDDDFINKLKGVKLPKLQVDKTGQSRQNLSSKLTRNKFTIQELKAIAAALNVTFDFTASFILPDGTKI